MKRALATLVLLLLPSRALAQTRGGFAVDRHEPAEAGSAWLVVDDLDLRGRARPALSVTLGETYKALVVRDASGEERASLLRHRLGVHVGGAVVLADRLRLGLQVPVALYQDGESATVAGEALAPATAPAIGDVRLAADVRLFGRHRAPLTLALGARAWLPTGLRSQLTSDGAARIAPQILAAGEVGVLVWAARASLAWRARDDAYAGVPLGSELTGAVGAGVRLGRFRLGPELSAATRLEAPFAGKTTPIELLLGGEARVRPDLAVSCGAGTGLGPGFGSPAARALVAVAWSPPPPEPPPPDRDRDAIPDDTDACPDLPGPRSGDPEANGCPLPERVPDEDTDADTVRDADDACPAVPGVRTADPMTNGCPEGTPRALAVVTAREIKIAEQVRFATNSAEVLGESDAVLAEVAKLLAEHPEILRVRVEGHTDDVGDARYNQELSERRAASVVAWLVAHGVEAPRLASAGYGSARPLAPNGTEEGRARNRRVVFTIEDRTKER